LKSAKANHDLAMLVLETPAGNIKALVNVDAHPVDVSLAFKDWIARTTKKVFPDICVFFAGHSLALDDG